MHKRVFRTLVSVILACAVLGGATAFAESATVTGSDVNLRSGPGTSYPVLDTLPHGAVVTVTDRSNVAWFGVSYNGVSGYMSSGYLSILEDGGSNATVVSTGSTSTAYVSAEYVRFRSGPGTGYSIISTFNRGKAVTVTGTSGNWTACTADGRDGYIFSDYLSSASASAPAQDNAVVSQAPVVNEDGSSNAVLIGGDSSGSYAGGGSSANVTVTPAATPAPASSDPGSNTSGTGSASIVIPATPGDGSAPVSTPAPTTAPAASGSTGTVQLSGNTGTINSDYVRFRTGPGNTYSILGSFNRGKQLVIKGTSGDWVLCEINGVEGYVYGQYVTADDGSSFTPSAGSASGTGGNASSGGSATVTTPTAETPSPTPVSGTPGYITGNNVRFRSGASMSSGILCELFYGNVVSITGKSGDWTAVTYEGKSGYVYSQYVREGSFQTGDAASSGGSAPVSTGGATGQQLVDYALQYLGYRYAWGGKTPETGFDCSGFMYYVYGQFGYTLNRVAADQAKNGVHVDAADIQPGDLICFYSGGSYIGHVGMYIGNNQFVHAATSSTGVIISDLSGYYAARGYEVRRIV